jgi:hypothetical protein
LLGIKVIKLNKIKGTRTIGSNLLAARIRRELFFMARNFRLPAQTKTNPTYRCIAVSFRTVKNLRSNPSPKNRRLLDA